jgi:DNA-binding LacI/PurR family transcriptional regulator
MADVARVAGVSVMTVSYAYARPERVSAPTRTKVRDAAERLGYPGPHPGARSLRRGRTGTLGVVLGEQLTYAFEDPQAARFLAGVADVCVPRGLGLTLLPITGEPGDAARVAEAAVDGFVVWTTVDDDPVLDAIVATRLPAVVHGGPRHHGMLLVAADDLAAARAVAAETFAGARRPAVLAFPLDRDRVAGVLRGPDPDAATFPVTRNRLRGFREAWHHSGGTWSDVRVAVCARNSAREAEDRALELLAGTDPPDAIAAMSDELALGAVRAAARLGLRVPGALAVSGWDDTDAAEAAGLTTVAQSLRDQGTRCAQLALGDPTAGERERTIEWSLIRRGSTDRRPATTAP